MGVFSAKTGKLSANGGTSAVASIRDIEIQYTSEQPEGNMSGANQGAPVSVPGPTDFTLSANFYGKTFPLLPGAASFNFEASNGTEVATGSVFTEEVEISCDIQGGGLLAGSLRMGGHGALTLSSGATAMTDANVPEAYPGVVCKAAWGPIAASPTMADISEVTGWTLRYSYNLNPYVASGSSAGATRRSVGSIRALEATVRVLNSQPSGLVTANMAPGQYGELRLYVTATEFFQIRWMGVTSLRETIPIEPGGNVELEAAMKWSSYRPVSGTQTVGLFKNPATSSIWP